MITVTPQGQIYICKTPLENDYKNQLTFTNKENQLNYFNSTIQHSFSDYTYVKKDNIVNVGINIDKIIDCNYLFYRNNGFLDDENNVRIFYCFITGMRYVNENCTEIAFETDCFQTWQFDINYKKCFVEREHVNDDTIGSHTIPEGLELGEYICVKDKTSVLDNPSDFYICMAVTELPDESTPPYSNHRVYNGIFGGLYYLVCKTAVDCENAIKLYDEHSKADAIVSIFMIPKHLPAIENGVEATWIKDHQPFCTVTYIQGTNQESTVDNINCSIPNKLGKNYSPKNNKLFTAPFSYMVLTNNSGISEVFKYEDFDLSQTINFSVRCSITPGMSIKAIPSRYKNISSNYNYGVMGGKLPVCSWNSDVYVNWLTQNGLNTGVGFFGNIFGGISSAVDKNIGGVVNGLIGAYNSMHQFTVADMTPNQAKGNTNSGDINFSYNGDGGLSVYYMSIRDEMAKIIDDYFSVYGYKVNSVKIPNITGRQNWNFVKTIDCNFDGDIPQSDLNTIKDMFNTGVTLWHSANNMYNYSLSNNIV